MGENSFEVKMNFRDEAIIMIQWTFRILICIKHLVINDSGSDLLHVCYQATIPEWTLAHQWWDQGSFCVCAEPMRDDK